MKAAVFFERDGVLNLHEGDGSRPTSPARLEQFHIRPEAAALLQQLKRMGFVLIATTNQPGLVQGRMNRNELEIMHQVLRRRLPLDDVLVCASDDPSHPCFKPQPGLFLEAAFKWSLDLDRSFVVSDKWQDAKAAQVAGCTSVMIQSPWIGRDHHDFVVPDLAAAISKIAILHSSLFCATPAVA